MSLPADFGLRKTILRNHQKGMDTFFGNAAGVRKTNKYLDRVVDNMLHTIYLLHITGLLIYKKYLQKEIYQDLPKNPIPIQYYHEKKILTILDIESKLYQSEIILRGFCLIAQKAFINFFSFEQQFLRRSDVRMKSHFHFC